MLETCAMGWQRDSETDSYWRPNGQPSRELLRVGVNVFVGCNGGSVPIADIEKAFNVTELQVRAAIKDDHVLFIENGIVEMDGV